jgi:hypothetical protein
MIHSNCRLTVREVAQKVGISKPTCHEILTFAVATAWSLLFAPPRHTLCYTSFRKLFTTKPTITNCLFTTTLHRKFQRQTAVLPEKVKN